MGFSLFLLWLFGTQIDQQERGKFFLLSKPAVRIPTNKLETESWNIHEVYVLSFTLETIKEIYPQNGYQIRILSSYLLFSYYILLYARLPITQFIYGSAYVKWNCKSQSHLNMVMIICSSVLCPGFTGKTELQNAGKWTVLQSMTVFCFLNYTLLFDSQLWSLFTSLLLNIELTKKNPTLAV